MPSLIAFLAAIFFSVSLSSIISTFAIESFVCHTSLAIATPLALKRPFHEAALVILAVNYLLDNLASGPPGLYALVLSLAFFAIFAVSQRIGGRFLLATISITAIASILVDLVYALLLTFFYPQTNLLAIFSMRFIPNAIATSLVAVGFGLVLRFSEKFAMRRAERTVAVD